MPKNNRPLLNDFILRVKMPADLHDKATQKAQQQGKTLSQIVRDLLKEYLGEK